MLRIISGKWRHRIIEQPDKNTTRATIDKVREAIFSSIRNELPGSIILDLFAGSGAMSFEALSNGSAKAIIVEKDKFAYKTILNNKVLLEANNADIFNMEAIDFLTTKINRTFDFVFLDPPYKNYDLLNKALSLLVTNNFLNKNAQIIIETDDLGKIVLASGLMIQKQKKYGKVLIAFVTRIN